MGENAALQGRRGAVAVPGSLRPGIVREDETMRCSGAATHDDVEEFAGEAIALGFRLAIDEAVRFIGATAPNPPVGCAILDAQGQILSVAAHHRAGEPHAEALALLLCREAGLMYRAAAAVVTLEPCNHTGRTGPCTEALLASPIREVWIGAPDPNPRVVGGGEARLREAGLDVRRVPAASTVGLDCAALIAPFATAARGGRPWITVKQALDTHGGMVPPPGAKTFTGTEALHLAHRLRRATDAIITGMGTILADSPHFTVRHLPDHPGRQRIIAVPDRGERLPDAYRREAESRGFLLRTAPDLSSLLQLLAREGVLWAMVEAGPRLLATIERDGLWDDWLTIRHDACGQDRFSVRGREAATPLRLIEGIPPVQLFDSTLVKGGLCSPVS
jgi:diaminohydroxyphosphoribosylaminopyrimidine deaminase / 5-amino-6-(5-phosphoribosylamino)uracil reductase